jgi:hypothetical protein
MYGMYAVRCFQGCPAYTPERTRSPRMSAVRILSPTQTLFYAPGTINVQGSAR